jgi:iron complex outermembrane receptor protein
MKAMINVRACLWLVLALVAPSFGLAQETPDEDDVQEAVADETDSLEAIRELEGEGDEVESPARLGSVTVTATRRETELNKTSIAVTAVDQETLTREGVRDIRDVGDLVPNLDIAFSPSDSGVQLTIRGINSNNFTEISDPSVAFHVDGVYSPRPQGAVALMYDLERLEVSRGPQGTLFGRNSAAGSINVVTAKPSFEGVFATAGFEVGNRGQKNVLATINAPLTDTIAFRANFFGEQRDGFADQDEGTKDLEGVGLSGPDGIPDMDQRWNEDVDEEDYYGNSDRWAARFSALWEPSENFDWRATYERYEDETAGWPVAPDCDRNPELCEYNGGGIDYVDPNIPGYLDMTIDSVRSHLSWAMLEDNKWLGDVDLIYNLGWARQQRRQQWDGDMGWRAVPGPTTGWLNQNPPWLELYLATDDSDYKSWSNEIQFQGLTGPVSWILGGFDFREDNEIIFDVEQPFCCSTGGLGGISFVQPDRDLESQAVFGQATWHFDEKWHFTAGFRYTHDEREDSGGKNIGCYGSDGCSWSAGRIENDGFPDEDQEDELILPLYTSADLGFGMGSQNRFENYEVFDVNDNQEDFTNFDWRFGIDYDLDRNSFMYLTAATGSKAGSFGDGVDVCRCGRTEFFEFDPEEVTNYEFGYKGTLLDGTLSLQFAAFLTDYDDKQVSSFRTVGFVEDPPGTPLEPPQEIGTLVTTNAASADIKGIELEFDYLTPWEGGRFTGFFAYLDTEFNSWPGYAGEAYFCDERATVGEQYACIPQDDGSGQNNVEGNELPYAVPMEFSLSYAHEFLLRDGSMVTPFVKVHWEDEVHMTEGNFDDLEEFSDKRDDYATVDMTLRYTSADGNWFVEAFGYNVTDERVQTYLADPGTAPGRPLFAWNAPRSYGMRFTYSFAGF